MPKPTEPFRNRLFEIPHKPPTKRITIVQQLRRQRTGNRIHFSLTNDPQHRAQDTKSLKKKSFKAHRSYVDRVVFADNLDSPKSPQSLTPPSSGTSSARAKNTTLPNVGKGSQQPNLKSPDDAIEKYLSGKRRASAQCLIEDLKHHPVEPDTRDNEILDFLQRACNGTLPSVSNKSKLKVAVKTLEPESNVESKRGKLLDIKRVRPAVDGALYGPIRVGHPQGIASKISEKFQLPKTMVDRLAKRNSAQNRQEKTMRKSMRGHMTKPFPTSDSSTEDEDCQDNIEDVKSLTLVRMGYCTIPKIKMGKRKRKDRLKTNRFLSKHQLNRIRYLFFDERQKWAQQDEVDLDKQPPPFVQRQIVTKSGDKPRSEQSFDQGHEKIFTKLKRYIREFQRQKDKETNKDGLVSFDGFRKGLLDGKVKNDTKTAADERKAGLLKPVSIFEEDQKRSLNKGVLKKFRIANPPKLFKHTRTRQSFRGIDGRDAQYVDPNFMTKQRFPELTKQPSSKCTLQSTMRYHTTIKERLQVNPVDYGEDRFGFGDRKYLSCLATDWDENFVQELQATKRFKKFRVKT